MSVFKNIPWVCSYEDWIKLSPRKRSWEITKANDTCGLYRFFDKNHNIVYIGKAVNLYRRIKDHEKWNEPDVFGVEVLTGVGLADIDLIEVYLINKHTPKYNKDCNRGGRFTLDFSVLDTIIPNSWRYFEPYNYIEQEFGEIRADKRARCPSKDAFDILVIDTMKKCVKAGYCISTETIANGLLIDYMCSNTKECRDSLHKIITNMGWRLEFSLDTTSKFYRKYLPPKNLIDERLFNYNVEM